MDRQSGDRERNERGGDRDGRGQSASGSSERDGRSSAVGRLHGSVGNQAVRELHDRGEVQARLAVSSPADRQEREARQVATAVVDADAPAVGGDGEGRSDRAPVVGADAVQRTDTSGDSTLAADIEREIRSVTGGGRPLSRATRDYFEPRFGRDFGDVRVHTGPEADAAARSIDAEAFTVGTDIAFAKGNYRPTSRRGRRLLAHELTHVVQQSGETDRTVQRVGPDPIGSGSDDSYEAFKRRLRDAMDGPGTNESVIRTEIETAPVDYREALLDDTSVLQRLANELTYDEANDVVWDSLMAAASNSTPVDAARTCFEERFDVDVGPDGRISAWIRQLNTSRNDYQNGGVPFGIKGLRRIYDVFKELPRDHYAAISSMAAGTKNLTRPAEGVAKDDMLVIKYDESNVTEQLQPGDFIHAGDAMQGMPALDTTTAHEFAHNLDNARGYSDQDEFRAISGWKEYSDAASAAADLRLDMLDPYGSNSGLSFTERERAVVDELVERVMERRQGPPVEQDLRDVYSAGLFDWSSTTEEGVRDVTAMWTAVQQTNLVTHLQDVLPPLQSSPWEVENTNRPYLLGHRYHLPYEGWDWVRYEQSARSDKMSWYQFRDPGEEFAELYATWHCTPRGQDPRDTVPDRYHDWFTGQRLHHQRP